LRRLLARRGLIRARDLEEIGVPRVYLTRLLRRGLITRAGRGLYGSGSAEVTAHRSLAEAAVLVPGGVVCLLSALEYHGLLLAAPTTVWMAVATPSARSEGPVRVIRMEKTAFKRGVLHEKIDGVNVPIFGLAKTIADCFLLRKKVGLALASAALLEYRFSRSWDADELWRYARICGVTEVMRQYVESLG
jgi:predicted transcriptional regulator of viral defense system